ncbi:glycosyltransferase family 4 protein [Sporolactobacillus sp. STSJ-5]|uniref:glycosyltransferase family 4 protein n=1 Tax=Sporolactobacillus sp. STSJ-5 TaxID=2965076 RepID=UPI002107D389|nr:glycosyltransferase family 1 protein [Sporolactobacillus sp. STSJ-5]MCQ2009525.1 glycosyltransferase family 4 protein [Sporolactobacillus sp. STSJ-5]
MRKIVTIDMRMLNCSGIGTYIANVTPLIINSRKDIDFFLLGHSEELMDFKKYPNVKIINCSAEIYSIKEQFELIKAIPNKNDLFWAPHYNIPILYRGNLLVTVHDIFHLAMPQYVNSCIKTAYAKFMFNAVKKKANKIITVSNFSRDELTRLSGCEQNKIITVHNGVSQKWFEEVGLEKTDPIHVPYLLYVGNVKPHKNLKNLIQAFKLIQNQIPHNLVIVGKKEGFVTGEHNIEQWIDEANGRIVLTGRVEDSVLKRYVANADIFVFPSQYEGFGLPPLEAMACGTPVAVSNIPPLKEVCGNCAAYFDPYSIKDIALTIRNLLNNKKRMTQLSRLGKQHATNFSWLKCSKEVQKVMKQIIENKVEDK